MGAVFLARDVRLDRFVAIKVLPPHLAADTDLRELFLREARTAGRLSHPHIVAVFRADEVAGHPFFAMPFIEGENLAERVTARGALPTAEAVRFLREVAWALAYAHARGVIHRDVKPENIMVERGSGRAIVTDFGIARVDGATLARDADIVGTASYMSPEQIKGEPLDGRSDLYALGVVGFLLLSGRLPFLAESVSALLEAHVHRPAPPLAAVDPAIPAPITTVIDRCLAKEREARYPTGESLADALEKALRLSEPVPPRAPASDALPLSPREAALVWDRAVALQIAALQELRARVAKGASVPNEIRPRAQGEAPSAAAAVTAGYSLRALEEEAATVGIPTHFVTRALTDLAASGALASR